MALACIIKGCTEGIFSLKMCQAHYARQRRGADINAPLKRRVRAINKDGTRVCHGCSKTKKLEDFQDNPKGLKGKLGTCRSCMRVKGRAYRDKNKEKLAAAKREGSRRRRAFLRGCKNIDKNVTQDSLRDRDGDLCGYCGVTMRFGVEGYADDKASIDHIIPLSKGGDHTFDNTLLCCLLCNTRKGNLSLSEWEEKQTWL